jgi:hypothetical protein
MIAKRITSKAAKPRAARLVKYMVDAEGKLDPRSWTRTADYMLASKTNKFGEKVGGVRVTNCHTDDPAAATTLIEATQAANTRSQTDKTYHLVFSFPPGEEPDLKTLNAIEDRLVAAIGYSEHQRISAVHIDTDHLHVHVAINKVHPKNYRNVEPYFDKKKLMVECDAIEIEYKLTRTNHGLTGERSHAKHNEIRLEPQLRINASTRKQLHKSHLLAAAAGDKRQNNYGMPELPGGDVAYIERGYSELLPGDARNSLLREREKHTGSLRWQGYGTGSDGNGLSTKQAEMEAHSGIESMTGFITRDVAPKVKQAKAWQELHGALAAHGLEIKKRGAGLVIGSGETWVKASTVDRSFSLKALSDRLGEFEMPEKKPAKTYEPKPKQSHPSSAVLFEQYQQEKLRHQVAQQNGMKLLDYQADLLEHNLKKWRVAQRLIVKAGAKGSTRKAMLKMVEISVTSKRKENWKTIDQQRKRLIGETSFRLSWPKWLAAVAKNGNQEALEVLRSRQKREAMQGNSFTAKVDSPSLVIRHLQPEIDNKGAITYRSTDGGLVIDRKTHVQCLRTTAGSSQLALEIAAARYKGQVLIVEGQEQFKKDVARLAGTYGVKVKFADPAIERARKGAQREVEI